MDEKEEKSELNIVRPPNFVYKYSSHGGHSANRLNPAQEVIQSEQGIFDFVGVKYPALLHKPDEFYEQNGLKREWFKYPVQFATRGTQTMIMARTDQPPLTEEEEKMGGQLSCFKDVPFPYKGHPSPEPIYAINSSKRLTRVIVEAFMKKDLTLPFLAFAILPRKTKLSIIERFITSYCDVCMKTAQPYILDFDYMTKYGKEIFQFITSFFVKFGIKIPMAKQFAESFAAQIDYDNAYWMKLGDAMLETTKEKMLENPKRELLKIAGIFKVRELHPANSERMEKAIKAMAYLLYLPRIRRIFKECVKESDFENFQADRADRYHTKVYSDYRYEGKELDVRMKEWEQFHRDNGTPLPPRLTITR